jgi:RHS repeat-associated protein
VPPSTAYGFGYDGLGRLIEASDPSGSTATYQWDKAANLLGTNRVSSSAVSITKLTPAGAPIGATVRIYGTGFGTTASQDSVSFNGTSATVTAAYTFELVVIVPSGAASGTVSVTAPGGSASSPAPFTVSSAAGPQITGASATVATPGTQLTVTGSNFSTTPADETLAVNRTLARVSAASATSLTWTVPGSAGSGPISAETPSGAATGPDLYVPPPGFSPSGVAQTGRVTVGGASQQVSIGTVGNIAMLIFDATAGQRVFINLANDTFSCGVLALYDPYNNQIATGNLAKGYVAGTTLPTRGTYTLVLNPIGNVFYGSPCTGSATVTVSSSPLASYTVTPTQAGAAVTIATPTAGQDAAVTFTETEGSRIYLDVSGSTYSQTVDATLLGPDGSTIGTFYAQPGGSGELYDMGEQTLPRTGTYTLMLLPEGNVTGSATFTFYQVPPDASYTVTPTQAGTPVSVAETVPGQEVGITFSATAGQRVYITFNLGFGSLTLYNPDGSVFGSSSNGGRYDMGESTLPQNGTYKALIDNSGSQPWSGTVTVYLVPPDSSYTVVPSQSGTAVNVATGTPGQQANITFSGTTGERIFIAESGWGYSGQVSGTLYNPDGTSANDMALDGSSTPVTLDMGESTLPQTGTYDVRLDPAASTGSVTLTFYVVPADASYTVTPTQAGSAVPVATRLGQNAIITFSGTAGERISMQASGWTYTPWPYNAQGTVYLTLNNPDGSNLTVAAMSGNGQSGYFDIGKTLPQTGTYTLLWDPQGNSVGSASLTFYQVPAAASYAVTPTQAGAAVKIATGTPGQDAAVTFSGTAGQRIFVQASNWSYAAAASSWLYLDSPAGGQVTSADFTGNGYLDMGQTTLPQTGTYTAAWNPAYGAIGSATLTFYLVPADYTSTITIGGSATAQTTTPGQDGRLTFTGTAGKAIVLTISKSSISTSVVSVLVPGGSTLTSGTFGTKGGTLSGTLSTAGTYAIFIDPVGSATGSMTIKLVDPPAAPTVPQADVLQMIRARLSEALRSAGRGSAVPSRQIPVVLPRSTSKAPAFWAPGHGNLRGDWTTPQVPSPWAQLPPLQARAGMTALAGQVLQLNGNPLAGVRVAVDGTTVTARTDATGRFVLAGLPAGRRVLDVNTPGTGPDSTTYATFSFGADVAAGQESTLPFTVWLPRLDPAHTVAVSSPLSHALTLTSPLIPGLEVKIPAGSTITSPGGQPVTHLSIIPVPVNRPPFPLPLGSYFPVYLSVQPAGAYVSLGAQIIYPNYSHLPAGSRVPFWNYDPAKRGWYIYGEGRVSRDGKQILPDPGVRVWQFTGAMISGSPPPPSGPGTCGAGDPVNTSTGTFVHSSTDLTLPGILPVTLSRTYRPGDTNSYSFGVGTTSNYDMRLWSQNNYLTAELILPDGADVHYTRVSPGTGWTDAIYQAQSTCTSFYGSTLHWNSNGWNLVTRTGLTYVFASDVGFGLSAIRDRYGNQVTITRASGGGPVTQVTGPDGRWITFTYDSANRITSATDNSGRAVTYAYNTAGQLASVTDPDNKATAFTYDPVSGWMTKITDGRGNTSVTNTYDSNGRVMQQTLGNETKPTTFAYQLSASGSVTQTTVTTPDGSQTIYSFNADGYPTSITGAAGTPQAEATAYAYQAGTDFLTSQTDALGRTTSYGYDSEGNLTTITQMAGTSEARTTTISYDPNFSQPTSVTDPMHHATSYGYDSTGELTSVTDPDHNPTTIGYSGHDGRPTSVTDAAGTGTTTYRYFLGDLASVTNADGSTSSYYDNSAGQLTQATDPEGNPALFGHDGLGDLTSITSPDGTATTVTYDANQNLTSVTDSLTNPTTYTYDNENRLATRQDAMGGLWTYGYDNEGDLTSIADPKGQTTTYQYDSLGRPSFAGYTTAGGTSYQSAVSYGYDAGNRLLQAADSAGGTFTQGWDDFNELTSQSGPNGAIAYSYNAAGRQTSATVTGQPQVSYGYDNAANLTSVSGGQNVALSYDADTRLSAVTLPDGITQNYTYDPASQLTGITYANGTTTLGGLSYAYDPDGNRTAEWGSYATLAIPQPSGPNIYNADNALVSSGATSYTYDPDGNLTTDGTSSYNWNARSQLTGITGPANASYTYDPFGRREQSVAGGTTTSYLYDGANVAQEQSGTTTANYLLGPGLNQRYARTDSTGTQSYLTDAHGSVIGLAGSTGTVQTTYTYDPFGATTSSGTASTNPYQYAGMPADSTGLSYDLARYYNPALGRFISQDPAGTAGSGANLYQYALGNPVDLIDPTGTFSWSDAILTVAVVVGGTALAAACVAGGCEAIAGFLAVDTLLSGSATNVIGSALIGAGTNIAGYYLTNPCRTLGGWITAGVTGAAAFGGGAAFGDAAMLTGKETNWANNSKLGISGWMGAAGGGLSAGGYLAANVDGPTAPGLITQGLIGAAGAYLTNPLILALLG